MTEEVKKEVKEESKQEVQLSEVEQKAQELGWRPKDDYQGDPLKWKSAEVFLALDEPIKRIESQSKELKDIKKALTEFKTHHSKVKETEFNRALSFLKGKKKEALENGDYDSVLNLDDQIDKIKSDKQQFEFNKQQVDQNEVSSDEVHPNFKQWMKENRWYEEDIELHDMADDIGIAYKAKYPDKSGDEMLVYITKQIKKTFPTKFTNPKKSESTPVESGSVRGTKASSSGWSPTDEQKQVAKMFDRQGVMKYDEYMKELKAMEAGEE